MSDGASLAARGVGRCRLRGRGTVGTRRGVVARLMARFWRGALFVVVGVVVDDEDVGAGFGFALAVDGAVDKTLEFAGADGMLKFADGLGLDLADAFAGDLEDASDFFEGVGVAVADAVAEFDDFAFAVGEGFEHLFDAVFEHFLGGGIGGSAGGFVFDEVSEVAVFAFADGAIEADGVLADFHDSADLGDGEAGLFGEFFEGGFDAGALGDVFLDIAQAGHGFDHVDGDADGSGVVGDGAGDGLSDPPCGIGAELVAAFVFVFIDRAHEAGVAFLDDIEEGQAAVAVFLGDGDDEAEVAAGEVAFGLLVFPEDGADVLDAFGKFVRFFEDEGAKAVEFLAHDLDVFIADAFGVLAMDGDGGAEFLHLAADGLEFAHEGDDAPGAKAEFFGEGGHAATAGVEAFAKFGDAGLIGLARVGEEARESFPVLPVEFEEFFDGAKVGGDALGDLLLGVDFGGRDAHGAIEGKFARVDLLEGFDGLGDDVVAFEAAASEDHAGGFDLFREANFLFTGEQWDGAHLREVHSDGVVDASAAGLFGDGFFEIADEGFVVFGLDVFGASVGLGIKPEAVEIGGEAGGFFGSLAAGDAHGAQGFAG